MHKGTVLPHLPSALHLDRISRLQVGAAAAMMLAMGGLLAYSRLREHESPEEIEFERRTSLAHEGRIIDGSIVGIDGSTEENSVGGTLDVPPDDLLSPHMLLYRYRVAGVTYECAQDVSSLADHVRNLRIDLPVQVRYDPRNPGNSIVVAEDWNGVRLDHPGLQHEQQPDFQRGN